MASNGNLKNGKPTTPNKRVNAKRVGGPGGLGKTWQAALDQADKTKIVPNRKQIEAVLSAPLPSFADVDSTLLPGEEYTEEHPWGRYQEESTRNYELFTTYLELGLKRTQGMVAKKHRINRAWVDKIARDFNWHDRAVAFDNFKERAYSLQIADEMRDMAKYHGSVARAGIVALATSFDALVRRAESDPDKWAEELDDMSVRTLFQLAHKSAQVLPNLMNAERLAVGLPTDLHGTVSVSEHRFTIQTSDDLASIAEVLFGHLQSRGDEAEDRLTLPGRAIEAGEEPHPATEQVHSDQG